MEKSRKNLTQIVVIILSILLLATGIAIGIKTNARKDSGLVIENGEASNVKLMTVTASTGVTTITATITPTLVANPTLSWNYEWQPTAQEAIDYAPFLEVTTPDDCITMEAVNNNSVNISYKAPFPVDLIIKCASVEKPTIFATCKILCKQRVGSIESTMWGVEIPSDGKTIAFRETTFLTVAFTNRANFSLGKVETTVTYNVKIGVSNEFAAFLGSEYEALFKAVSVETGCLPTFGLLCGSYANQGSGIIKIKGATSEADFSAKRDALFLKINNYKTTFHGKYIVTATDDAGRITEQEFKINFHVAGYEVKNVALDKTEVVI